MVESAAAEPTLNERLFLDVGVCPDVGPRLAAVCRYRVKMVALKLILACPSVEDISTEVRTVRASASWRTATERS